MDVLQNKMRSRVSSLQQQAVENIETANGYSKEESDELKELGSAKAINFIKKRKIFVISFLLVAAIGYGVYGKYFNLTDAEVAQKELSAAVAAVGGLMILPEGDEPVLATVTDAETLIKQQAFFAGAVNGDQLLLFPKSLKAVIYSPSRNKIINAGPIEQQQAPEAAKSEIRNPAGNLFSFGEGPKSETPNQSSQSSDAAGQANLNVSSSAEATAGRQNTLTVEIRNGTGKNGLAAQVAENIRAAGYAVVAVTDAKITNYAKTIVFNRAADEAKKQSVNELAVALGAEVVRELSRGEANTEADALVILGGE